MASFTADVVGSLDGLTKLEPHWRALAEEAGAEPFQSFDWHAAWLATLGQASGHRPHLAVLRHGGRLVGLLPSARRWQRGLRILEWSGHGMTDYNSALLAPDLDPQPALAAMWRAAVARGVDVARLTHLVPGSASDRFLTARGAGAVAGETSWALPLAGLSGEAWLAGLSAKLRHNHHRYTRRLADAGGRFWVWTPGEPTAPFLEALLAQKRAWFRERGEASFLDRPAGPAFLASIIERFAARGALQLAALRAGDQFIACSLNYLGRDTLYGYMISRDPAWNRFGPGQLLVMHLIRWCADHGFAKVDLLGGDQDFKPRLGCRPTRSRNHLLACSLVGRVALAARRAGTALSRRPAAALEVAAPLPAADG